MEMADFTPGMRVWSAKRITEGTVIRPARTRVHVTMDDGKVRTFAPDELEKVLEVSPLMMPRSVPAWMPKLSSVRYGAQQPVLTASPDNARARRLARRNGPASLAAMMRIPEPLDSRHLI